MCFTTIIREKTHSRPNRKPAVTLKINPNKQQQQQKNKNKIYNNKYKRLMTQRRQKL